MHCFLQRAVNQLILYPIKVYDQLHCTSQIYKRIWEQNKFPLQERVSERVFSVWFLESPCKTTIFGRVGVRFANPLILFAHLWFRSAKFLYKHTPVHRKRGFCAKVAAPKIERVKLANFAIQEGRRKRGVDCKRIEMFKLWSLLFLLHGHSSYPVMMCWQFDTPP